MPGPFRHRIRVRYSECDLQGVVFNANYLTYLDDTMTELLRAALDGGYERLRRECVDMVVAQSSLRYLAPARFDDEIEVEASISRLGDTGMTVEMEVKRGRDTLTEAQLRYVFVRAKEGGKTPIPGIVRAALEPWLAAGQP